MKQISFPSLSTVGDIAQAVGCSTHIIRVLADSGRLPHFRDYNGWRRFSNMESTVEIVNKNLLQASKKRLDLEYQDANQSE